MLDYAAVKATHIGCVILSISGFSVRGLLMLADSPLIWHRVVRTLPHLVDTVLLGSGVWLAVLLKQYPGQSDWLSAKLLALVAYIVLGFIALRLGKTRRQRITALVAALLCFAYMAAVAWHKNPLPLL